MNISSMLNQGFALFILACRCLCYEGCEANLVSCIEVSPKLEQHMVDFIRHSNFVKDGIVKVTLCVDVCPPIHQEPQHSG